MIRFDHILESGFFAGLDDRFHALFAEFAKVCSRERMAYRPQGAAG